VPKSSRAFSGSSPASLFQSACLACSMKSRERAAWSSVPPLNCSRGLLRSRNDGGAESARILSLGAAPATENARQYCGPLPDAGGPLLFVRFMVRDCQRGVSFGEDEGRLLFKPFPNRGRENSESGCISNCPIHGSLNDVRLLVGTCLRKCLN